jgi:hypothetical protein
MRKVVLDTNVIISGMLIDRGPSAQILDAWRKRRFTLVTSEAIIAEVRDVLNDAKLRAKYPALTRARIGRFINLLRRYSIITPGELALKIIEQDPDDDKVIIAAVEGGAEAIVSGDDDLLNLKAYRGIRIVSPAEFIKVLD